MLSNPEWIQANSYPGLEGYDIPEMEIFINGDAYVEGLTFNNILISYSDLLGIEGSLPEEIVTDEIYNHSFTFDLTEPAEKGLIRSIEDLKVVASVVDSETGYILNSNLFKLSNMDSKVSPEFSDEGTEIKYFNLNGFEVKKPTSGIFIKITYDRTGKVQNQQKIIIR